MMRIILLVAAITAWAVAGTALGQSETFTYQGQLKLNGAPVSDLVDMKFTLFDSESATTAVAGPLLFNGVGSSAIQVTNGLFSVELDFGAGALQLGQWLKIEIRFPHSSNNTAAYTALTPRQKISAAAFALSVPGLASNEAGVEVEGNIHAAGEMIASAFSSNSPLIFKVNPSNTECARFDDANCYMGLGTNAPQARLHLGGVAGVDGIMFPDGSIQTTAAGLGGGGAGFWTGAGTNIYNNNGGRVGIGTTDPHHRLRISGGPLWTSNQWTGSLELDNASAISWRGNAAGRRFGIGQTNSGLYFFHSASDPGTTGSPAVYDMYINDAGNVAIGAGAAGTAKLDISASGEGAELLRFTTERPWVFRQIRTGPSAGLQLLSTTGQKKFEITANDGSNVATFLADATASKLGLGTVDPIHRLHVSDADAYVGLFSSSHANASIVKFHSASSNSVWEHVVAGSAPSYGVGAGDLYIRHQGIPYPAMSLSGDTFIATLACADLKIGHPTRRGAPGRAVVDNSDHLVINFANDWAYTYVHGRLKVGILEIAGADVAEKFLSSDDRVEPGTVMEIDPDNVGQLRVARAAYSSRVAGVVSGAGDIPTGAVLGNLPGHEDAPPIALSGRVWVQCDAGNTSIAPGDLLTTSEIAGHAMKSTDRDRSHGAVIGKAMSALAYGERGLVLVLVNLQ